MGLDKPRANKKPILVTGCPRTGTTWVGKMLCASPAVGYIEEPFNPDMPLGRCAVRFAHTFTYIIDENAVAFYEPLQNTIAFRYNVAAEIKRLGSLTDVRRMLRDYIKFYRYRSRDAIPLLKAPVALFSAEWLAATFDMDVVVLIRHPAAVGSSYKRLQWDLRFADFLEQPLLMRDHLYPFEAEIREYVDRDRSIVEQAGLLWKLTHYMVLKYRERHRDWTFLRYEDLAADPIGGFGAIFGRLGVDFSDRVQAVIAKHSAATNPRVPKHTYSTVCDSKSRIEDWKKGLTTPEIERIRSGVEDISSAFYSDADW
jgi:hypothetical protein